MKKTFTIFFMLLFIVMAMYYTQAQTNCDVFIQSSFDSDCVTFVEPKPGEKPDFELEETACLLACSGSEVIYYARSLPPNSTCEWTVTGGQSHFVSNNGTSVTVRWPDEAVYGNIALQVTYSDSLICLTEVCIEVIERPTAGIISNPMETEIINNVQHLYVCDGQVIDFYSNSTGSADAPIVAYYWTDGQNSSSEQDFTFTASHGQYGSEVKIYHKVINECGCYDDLIYMVHISKMPQLKVDCYGTICEGMTVTYATIEGNECQNYLWSVEGGDIIAGQSTNTIQVLWNDVDANGYGYLAVDNTLCDPEGCPYLTYLPIPVIVDTVNILGPDTVCVDEWQTYEVPLWGSSLYSWSIVPYNGISYSYDVTRNKYKLMFTIPGTYTIDLEYRNDFLNCSGEARSKTVVVKETFTILSDEKACEGSEVSFTTNVSGNDLFLWQIYDNNRNLIFEYTGNALDYTFTLAGSYTVTAYNDRFCAVVRKGISILELPHAPTPDVTNWASKVCFNNGYIYTATNEAPYFLHWEAPYGDPATFDGNEYNVSFSRAGYMTLQNVDPIAGCLSEPYTFQIREFVPQALNLGNLEVCPNGITSIQVPNESEILYEWESQSPDKLSIASGKYSYLVQVQANNTSGTAYLRLKRKYCNIERSDIVTVTIQPGLVPVIDYPTEICQGESYTLRSANTGNTVAGNWTWGIGGNSYSANNVTQTNQYYTFNRSGTIPVRLTFTSSACNIPNSTIVSVVVNPKPNVSLGFSSSGTTGILSASQQAGNTYSWSTGQTGNPIIVATPFASTYYCTITNANGCSVVEQMTTLNDTTTPPSCPDIASSIDVNVTCGTAAFTYHSTTSNTYMDWRIANNSAAPIPTVNPNNGRLASAIFTNAGTYVVSVKEIDNGCLYTTRESFVIPLIPRMSVEHNCSSNNNNITLTLRNNSDYIPGLSMNSVWRINGAVVTPNSNGEITVPAAINIIKLTITYTYHGVTETCEVEETFNHVRSTAAFSTSPTVYCSETPIQFTDLSSSPVAWQWSWGTSTNLNQNPILTFTTSANTSVDVTLRIQDQLGCYATTTQPLTVRPNNLNGSLTSNPPPYCSGTPWPVTYEYTIGAPPLTTVNYQWLPINEIGTVNSHSFTRTGDYHVFLEQPSTSCQFQSDAINLKFENVPTAFISGNDEFCFDEAIKLYGNSGFSYNYTWTNVNTNTVIATTPNLDISAGSWQPGTYRLRLLVSNGNCSASVEKTITIHAQAPAPPIRFNGNVCIHNPPVHVESSNGSLLYWSTGTYGSATDVYVHGFTLAHYLDGHGCKSRYGTILVERSPNFDELLTGCFKVCKEDLTKYLVPPSGTYGHWNWIHNGTSIRSGNGSIGMLPVPDFGIYNLDIEYNNGQCLTTSPDLVVEQDKYCPCEIEMEVLEFFCIDVRDCMPLFSTAILINNLSSLYSARIIDIYSSNGYVDGGHSSIGQTILPDGTRVIHFGLGVSALLSGHTTVTVRFQQGEKECEVELAIDLSTALNDCITDDCEVKFIDYYPNGQFSNAGMLYYDYEIYIGSDRVGIEVYSDDVITSPFPQYYDDNNGIIYGIFSITPARMREIIMNGEQICFTVKSCHKEKLGEICVREVCFKPEFDDCEVGLDIKYAYCFVEDCVVYIDYNIFVSNYSGVALTLVSINNHTDGFHIHDIEYLPMNIAGNSSNDFYLMATADPDIQQAELTLFFINEEGIYCQSTLFVPVEEIMRKCIKEDCKVSAEAIAPNPNLSNANYIYFDFVISSEPGAVNSTVSSSHGYVTSHFYNSTNGRIEGTVRLTMAEYILLIDGEICFEVTLCFPDYICIGTTCIPIKELECDIKVLEYNIKCGVDKYGLYLSIDFVGQNVGNSTLTLTDIFLSEGTFSQIDYHTNMPVLQPGQIGNLSAYFYISNFESNFLNNVFFFEASDGSLCLFTGIIDLQKYISDCMKETDMECADFRVDPERSTTESIYVEFTLHTIQQADLQAIYSSQIDIDNYTYDPQTGLIVVGAYLSGDELENILLHNNKMVCFTAYLLDGDRFFYAKRCCEIKIEECDIKAYYKELKCFVQNGELYIEVIGLTVMNYSSMVYLFETIMASHLELVSTTPSLPYALYPGVYQHFDLLFKVENPEADVSHLFMIFQQDDKYCWQHLEFPIRELVEKDCVTDCQYEYEEYWKMNYSLSGNGYNYIDFTIEFPGTAGHIVGAEIHVMNGFQQIADIVNYTYTPNSNILRGLIQVPENYQGHICLMVYITDKYGDICKMKICFDMDQTRSSMASGGENNQSGLDDISKTATLETFDNADNILSPKSILLYPNPANNTCAVNIDQSLLMEIIIFDMRGTEISKYKSVEFSVANLAAGSYIVSVRMLDNTIYYLKLVKR